MKINIFCVGTIKEKFKKEEIAEYLKRLSKYAQINIIETKESVIQNKQIDAVLDEEGENILKRIKDNEVLILSDLHGEELTSEEFASLLEKLINQGKSPINFAIGGTMGVSQKLRERSTYKICLSKLTFTHQMTRAILLEQIYRAFKIINNESYHH
ncbi:MAG: 23S rRNA (pseudouridine(1915)-N(3))-methyltransferase RlmH [Bacilli bacterium]|nr:23S rRNA (pseudouridine(1915)-N(3))-methyltransferase RlmH [Bacilli bacterium]